MRLSCCALSLRLSELTLHPVELAADVVHDIAGLQIVRQHVPRIRLDLEGARQRLRLVELARVLYVIARVAEWAEVFEEYRHVEVGAPFARTGVLFPGVERVLEIEEARELAVLLLDGLREIDRLRVGLEHIDDLLRHLRHMQRCCFLQLEDRHAGIDKLLQTGADVLELYRLMADVEHDADMAAPP